MKKTRQPTLQIQQNKKDYDIDVSGWGGDYSDPKTYLAILDPETGSQLKTWACLKERQGS